jgi:stringent starvation protein B
LISSRPYLIRAIYDWIVDSGLTPYMLVNAQADNVTVPTQYIQDGKIILNIGPQAVRGLELTNEWVMFSARFSGVSMEVSLPPHAVLAIYAKENGRGMVFSEEDEPNAHEEKPEDEPPGGGGEPPLPPKGRPSLRVVK